MEKAELFGYARGVEGRGDSETWNVFVDGVGVYAHSVSERKARWAYGQLVASEDGECETIELVCGDRTVDRWN